MARAVASLGEEAARTVMATIDPDLRRSQLRLIAAFREASLTAEPEVLLQRIVKSAAVTRAEFHAHFSGVEELAVAALIEEVDVGSTIYFTARVENRLTGTQISENAMAYVLGFIDARRTIYRQTLTGQSSYATAAEQALVANARDYLRAQPRESAYPEVAARMFGAGVLGVIRWWLTDEPDISSESLAREVSRVVPLDFTH
jgi:AcrR family transcriptional regulator